MTLPDVYTDDVHMLVLIHVWWIMWVNGIAPGCKYSINVVILVVKPHTHSRAHKHTHTHTHTLFKNTKIILDNDNKKHVILYQSIKFHFVDILFAWHIVT